MKLPLVTPLKSRNGTSNKDGRLTNVLAEQRPSGETVAQARPGLTSVIASSGNGNGLVSFNGELISVYGATVGAGTGGNSGSWSKVSSTASYNPGVVACNGSIAVNPDQSSTDGINWSTYVPVGTVPDTILWFIGSDMYGIRTSTPRLKKSTDNGVTWTNMSILPSGGGDVQTLAYFNSTMFLYDTDTGQTWTSSDFGLNWTEQFPTSTLGVGNSSPFFVVNGNLYIFDGLNGQAWVSSDGLEFTFYPLYTGTGLSIGHYEAGFFYGHNFLNGDIFKIPESSLSSYSAIGSVAPASVAYEVGQPFKIGSSMFCFGVDGVYSDTPSITPIGTVTDSFFDFVQSTT